MNLKIRNMLFRDLILSIMIATFFTLLDDYFIKDFSVSIVREEMIFFFAFLHWAISIVFVLTIENLIIHGISKRSILWAFTGIDALLFFELFILGTFSSLNSTIKLILSLLVILLFLLLIVAFFIEIKLEKQDKNIHISK